MNDKGQESTFPIFLQEGLTANSHVDAGISRRAYAAIQLRVPDSGEEWLDDMIRKSNRLAIASKILCSLIELVPEGRRANNDSIPATTYEEKSNEALEFADELIKQSGI